MQILHKQFHNLINSSTNDTRKTLYQTSDFGRQRLLRNCMYFCSLSTLYIIS
jgi:hypothetical protein